MKPMAEDRRRDAAKFSIAGVGAALICLFAIPTLVCAVDKLVGIHSARVLSQSMPWVAREAGLFKKYNLDFDLVFIASSPLANSSNTAFVSAGGATAEVAGV